MSTAMRTLTLLVFALATLTAAQKQAFAIALSKAGKSKKGKK